MKIIFLDVDGVLNGHEWDDEAKSCTIRRECVKHLNRVVIETGCNIVLSSAWRYMVHGGSMTLRGFGYMLRTHGLISPGGTMDLIVGLTEKDAVPCTPGVTDVGERGRQCRAWLDNWMALGKAVVSVKQFVAVDDEDHDFSASGIPAVITDGRIGMTEQDADKLIEILRGKPSEAQS